MGLGEAIFLQDEEGNIVGSVYDGEGTKYVINTVSDSNGEKMIRIKEVDLDDLEVKHLGGESGAKELPHPFKDAENQSSSNTVPGLEGLELKIRDAANRKLQSTFDGDYCPDLEVHSSGGPGQPCADVPGWHDSGGPYFACDFYASNPTYCELFGDSYEFANYTAKEASHVCFLHGKLLLLLTLLLYGAHVYTRLAVSAVAGTIARIMSVGMTIGMMRIAITVLGMKPIPVNAQKPSPTTVETLATQPRTHAAHAAVAGPATSIKW